MRYEFTVIGKVVPKARPRFSRGRTYTPKTTVDYEKLVRNSFLTKYHNPTVLEGSLEADIMCYFPIPKSTSKKNRNLMLLNEILPTVKPDLDNLAKAILDALNGYAYKDDSQVAHLNIYKYYSEEPRADVVIQTMSKEVT